MKWFGGIWSFVLGVLASTLYAQSVKLPNWQQAGTSIPAQYYQQIEFTGDLSGKVDNSPLLQKLLDTLKKPTVVVFGTGTYLFKTRILLPTGCVIRGRGALNTILDFNLNAVHAPCIEIRGTENSTIYPITANASIDSSKLEVDNKNITKIKPGALLRIYQNDSTLMNDSWAYKSAGQIVEVASIQDNLIILHQQLRQNYLVSKSAGFKIITPALFNGIEHLKIIRRDYTNTGAGSSNIVLRYAWKTIIKSIESENCNFAHLEANYSGKLLVEDCYFHDAFNFGGSGRAYGVMLQYSTGDALVQNNIFKTLRHAMILQAGANGNVFAYNHATQSKKEIFPGIFGPGEDIAVHGNYPFANLFEGNEVNIASVDNSHGRNGPANAFFRNRIVNGFLWITNAASEGQYIAGNHLVNSSYSFASSGNYIADNSWQGISSLSINSLFFKEKPGYLNDMLILPGAPNFSGNPPIPAKNRFQSGQPIGAQANELIWDGKSWNSCLQPGKTTSFCSAAIYPGNPVLLEPRVALQKLELKPGAFVQLPSNGIVNLSGQ